jgi:hypothetical protein
MGMVGCLAAIDTKTIQQLQADPEQMDEFLNPDDGDGELPNSCDLDKAWHCIHFMLCGDPLPSKSVLSLAILGGTEIGDDVGYGPARILQPEQVRDVAVALSQIDSAAFKVRYEPERMQKADVYLADMCVRDGDDAFDYLLDNYMKLVAFYREAAQRGDGAILWLS